MALEAGTPRRVPHCTVVWVVVVDSDGGQSDNQAVHVRSNLESCVESRGYGVEKERVHVAMADVGLQGGNPVAGHVQISELVHDRIVEKGTGIVDPETPVDCSR